VNIFVILTINITLYLPPGLQRTLVARQAVALSGLPFSEIGTMALAEKEPASMIFIAITTILN
jgi:hypothetical protein